MLARFFCTNTNG